MLESKKNEAESMKRIAVGIYADSSDDSVNERIAQISAFLTKNGGSCDIERKKVDVTGADLLIIFHAMIPEWFTNMHHAFDSVLNSTSNGFGVAWVEDE